MILAETGSLCTYHGLGFRVAETSIRETVDAANETIANFNTPQPRRSQGEG